MLEFLLSRECVVATLFVVGYALAAVFILADGYIQPEDLKKD